MTKRELIEFLKPFSDEIEILTEDLVPDPDAVWPKFREINPRYIFARGEGIVVLAPGSIL